VPLVRLTASISAILILSACASLPGIGSQKSAKIDDAVNEDVAQQVVALEVEVAWLKSENARLSNQVLGFKRDNDQLSAQAPVIEVVPNDAQDDAQNTAQALSQTPGQGPVILQPPANNGIVVAETAAPELRGSDVPIDDSPRLVQPTFASTETVFENEAIEGEIETASVLHGVHLASYRKLTEAREGWQQLQRENPEELGLLEPRIETVSLPEKGDFLRLIGGGFSSREKADELCQNLNQKGLFCTVSGFGGERMALENARPG